MDVSSGPIFLKKDVYFLLTLTVRAIAVNRPTLLQIKSLKDPGSLHFVALPIHRAFCLSESSYQKEKDSGEACMKVCMG